MNASTMRRARCYTLIEVIVAFAVLALALTLLLGTLSGASRQLRWADDAGRASLHAQSLIDQLGVGARQVGQMITLDFHQAQPVLAILTQQRTYHR